jgi:hypothetical protein
VSTRTLQPSLTTEAGLKTSAGGAVTVVDGQNLVSNAFVAKRTSPLLVSGAVLHVLPAGANSISLPVPCSPIRQLYLIPRCSRGVRQRQSCGMYGEKSPLRDYTLVIANPW